jgi:hypothetical protein
MHAVLLQQVPLPVTPDQVRAIQVHLPSLLEGQDLLLELPACARAEGAINDHIALLLEGLQGIVFGAEQDFECYKRQASSSLAPGHALE